MVSKMALIPLGYQYLDDPYSKADNVFNLLCYDDEKHIMVPTPYYRSHRSYLLTLDSNVPQRDYVTRVTPERRYSALQHRVIDFKKVCVVKPSNITKLREQLHTSWEDHIFYHLNYAYDHNIVYGAPHEYDSDSITLPFAIDTKDFKGFVYNLLSLPFTNYKRCAFDIEVESTPGVIPNVERAENRILAASIMGVDGLDLTLLLADEKHTPDMSTQKVHYFSEEFDLILALFHAITPYPIKVTHGGNNFDCPYLYNRAHILGIDKMPEGIPIVGRQDWYSFDDSVHLDTALFFGHRTMKTEIFRNKYPDARLETLARILLGKEKMEIQFENIEQLGVYCRNDTALTLELTTFQNNLTINLLTVLCRVLNMDVEFIINKTPSTWTRSYYHFFHRLLNYLIPNDTDFSKFNIGKSTYKGAIVLSPVELGTVGTHFDVWALDYASMYPSIIVEHNLSYDTYNCGHPECKEKNTIPEVGHHFCIQHKGILPIIFDAYKSLRLEFYKPKMRELEEQWNKSGRQDKAVEIELAITERIVDALRIILNQGYGVFGSVDIEDLFCLPVVESITAVGRHSLKTFVSETQAMHGIVLQGHTDSGYVKNLTSEQVDKLIQIVHEKTGLELEKQAWYKFMSCWRKGNYLAVDKYGNVKVSGLMGKKKHIPPYIKGNFEQLKKIIANIDDPNGLMVAKKEIEQLVKDSYKKLKNGQVPIVELSFEVTLHKEIADAKGNSQYYAVAKLYKEHVDKHIGAGDTIRQILTVGENKAMPLELVKDSSMIDVESYAKHIVKTFNQVLDPLGISAEDIIAGSQTTSLDNWFT